MTQQNARRYFVADDADAEQLKEMILSKINAQRGQHRALAAKYEADEVVKYDDGRVVGLAFKSADGEPAQRDGLTFRSSQPDDGFTWHTYKPNRRTKIGKQLQADMSAIKAYSGSDTIVRHYGAYRHAVVPHAGSTGMAMAVSVGGIVKGKVVLSVPVSENEPFDPPTSLREIKKSEWIALTEE